MMCEIGNVISKVNNRRISVLNFAEKVNEELFEIYGYSDVKIYRDAYMNCIVIAFVVLDDESKKIIEVKYDTYTLLNADNIQELYDIMRQAIKDKLDIDLDL